jgi:hypothetical protein
MIGEHLRAGYSEVSVVGGRRSEEQESEDKSDGFATGHGSTLRNGKKSCKGWDRADNGKVRGTEHAQAGWHRLIWTLSN